MRLMQSKTDFNANCTPQFFFHSSFPFFLGLFFISPTAFRAKWFCPTLPSNMCFGEHAAFCIEEASMRYPDILHSLILRVFYARIVRRSWPGIGDEWTRLRLEKLKLRTYKSDHLNDSNSWQKRRREGRIPLYDYMKLILCKGFRESV